MFHEHFGQAEGGTSWPSFTRGTEVAGFLVEGRLDAGSFGTVYRARRSGRPFAIKLVPLDPRGDREVEALRRVRHPNVVGFHGYGFWPHEEPRFLVLALELVEGWPLDVWAREGNPSALELVRQVLLPVVRSLAEVHAAGVVHRDVKEANILVREGDGQPVLVDFGAATYEGAPRLTKRLPPGTPEYRSPEVLRFAREWEGEHYPAGPADDLWALGVTFYVLLTRELPFGDRHGALTQAILTAPPEPPQARNPRIPPALGAVCLRLLDKDPAARFADALSFARALEDEAARADDGWHVPLFPGPRRERRSPPMTGPGLARARPSRGWRRPRVLLGLLAVVLLRGTTPGQLPRAAEPVTPRETLAGPPPPREAGLGREVARGDPTEEVGGRETNSREEDAMPRPPKARSVVKTSLLAGAVCVGSACVTGRALAPPPPADCPPGSDATHERFGIRGTGHGVLFAPYDIQVQPVKEGPITARTIGDWAGLSGRTVFSGRIYFGKERLYVRFTQAELSGGERLPVCVQVMTNQKLGMPLAPGSTRKTVLMYPSISVETVHRFD